LIAAFEMLLNCSKWANAVNFLAKLGKGKSSAEREAAAYIIKMTGLNKLNYPLAGDLANVLTLPQELKSAIGALNKALPLAVAELERAIEEMHEENAEAQAEMMEETNRKFKMVLDLFARNLNGTKEMSELYRLLGIDESSTLEAHEPQGEAHLNQNEEEEEDEEAGQGKVGFKLLEGIGEPPTFELRGTPPSVAVATPTACEAHGEAQQVDSGAIPVGLSESTSSGGEKQAAVIPAVASPEFSACGTVIKDRIPGAPLKPGGGYGRPAIARFFRHQPRASGGRNERKPDDPKLPLMATFLRP